MSVRLNTIQSQFRFSVPIKVSEKFDTPEIIVGGAPWKIQVLKTQIYGENSDRDAINVSLVCEYKGTQSSDSRWWIEAGATLRLITFNETTQPMEKKIEKYMFGNDCLKAGIKNFIEWSDLIDEKNGFIKNEQFTFEAMITSSPLRTEKSPTLGFEITSTQFDMFIPTVEYSNGTTYTSPPVILRGVKWFVSSVETTAGLEINLSNEADPDNFGWSFIVHFKAKLLSFDDEIAPIEKNLKQRFTTEGNQIGWKPFIEYTEMLNEEFNFVKQNKAVFEISIDVGTWRPSCRNEKGLLENGTPATSSKCPICLEKLGDQGVKITLCGHLFCGECIVGSIEEYGKCPLCNKNATLKELRAAFLFS